MHLSLLEYGKNNLKIMQVKRAYHTNTQFHKATYLAVTTVGHGSGACEEGKNWPQNPPSVFKNVRELNRRNIK